MTLTQILAWLSGPTVGSALSYLLDQWQPWKDWKPKEALGFNLKAVIITAGSLLVGFGAWAVATTIPEATISQIDPYVSAAFPLLTLLGTQIWHALVNKRLAATTVSTSTDQPGTISTTVTTEGAENEVG